MAGTSESWGDVLAAVEADMLRSSEAVYADSGTDRFDTAGPVLTGALGPMSLGAPAPVLPPLDEMPPVPVELRDRILELRAHIVELQMELAVQMEEWRDRHADVRRPGRAVTPVALAAQAYYVDRRL